MNVLLWVMLANAIGTEGRAAAALGCTRACFVATSPMAPTAIAAPVAHRTRGSTITGVGVGYPPPGKHGAQARLLARRAAEVRATSDLARRLGRPRSGRIRGVEYVSYHERSDGSVEVVAALPSR